MYVVTFAVLNNAPRMFFSTGSFVATKKTSSYSVFVAPKVSECMRARLCVCVCVCVCVMFVHLYVR